MRVAACQILSTPVPADNLELVRSAAFDAAERGARIALFPEATMACFRAPLRDLAEPIDGPWARRVRAIAGDAGVIIVAGMFTPAGDGRVRNTLLVTGHGVEERYDKIHLFDAFGFTESRTVAPGTRPVVIHVDGIGVGLAICYDIRFPALFSALARAGATVMLVAASWGAGDGKRDQWELLARARAADTTSWVVACGQADPRSAGVEHAGTAPTGIGFSTAVDPFGSVVSQLGAHAGILVVDVDLDTVRAARAAIPVLAHHGHDFGVI